MKKRISLDEAKKLIQDHELISFDIFDTLLLRSVDKPTDIFLRVEEELAAERFAKARIHAERKARIVHRGNEDVTIDQIYEEIDDSFAYLKSAELQAERKYTYVNEITRELYEYAHQLGKQTVICSDMYLTRDFLTELLADKGFNRGDEVYVSSELLKSKSSGSLFRYLVKQKEMIAKNILHIGDNIDSDGNAVNLGMGFIQIKKDRMTYIEYDAE